MSSKAKGGWASKDNGRRALRYAYGWPCVKGMPERLQRCQRLQLQRGIRPVARALLPAWPPAGEAPAPLPASSAARRRSCAATGAAVAFSSPAAAWDRLLGTVPAAAGGRLRRASGRRCRGGATSPSGAGAGKGSAAVSSTAGAGMAGAAGSRGPAGSVSAAGCSAPGAGSGAAASCSTVDSCSWRRRAASRAAWSVRGSLEQMRSAARPAKQERVGEGGEVAELRRKVDQTAGSQAWPCPFAAHQSARQAGGGPRLEMLRRHCNSQKARLLPVCWLCSRTSTSGPSSPPHCSGGPGGEPCCCCAAACWQGGGCPATPLSARTRRSSCRWGGRAAQRSRSLLPAPTRMGWRSGGLDTNSCFKQWQPAAADRPAQPTAQPAHLTTSLRSFSLSFRDSCVWLAQPASLTGRLMKLCTRRRRGCKQVAIRPGRRECGNSEAGRAPRSALRCGGAGPASVRGCCAADRDKGAAPPSAAAQGPAPATSPAPPPPTQAARRWRAARRRRGGWPRARAAARRGWLGRRGRQLRRAGMGRESGGQSFLPERVTQSRVQSRHRQATLWHSNSEILPSGAGMHHPDSSAHPHPQPPRPCPATPAGAPRAERAATGVAQPRRQPRCRRSLGRASLPQPPCCSSLWGAERWLQGRHRLQKAP